LENSDFTAISEKLANPSKVLLTTHSNPDGDAIGSCLAFFSYLKKKNHAVKMIIPDPFPEFLAWMSGHEEILDFENQKNACLEAIKSADLIFALDFNNLSRLNNVGKFILESSSCKMLIDHHLFPSDEFLYKISTSLTSSTSELVFDFIKDSGDIHLIDKEMAACLYAGIITDTGSLSYSCNYVKTYLTIAELYKLGIDGEHIHRLIYDTFSENRLRLLGYSISDKLTVLPEFHTAYITLSKEDLQRFNYEIGDTEGVVNYALSIKDINLAALFMERDGIVKVSFRSKGNFSVEEFAREHFDGGGHHNASGANCQTTLKQTIAKFKALLPVYQSQLKLV